MTTITLSFDDWTALGLSPSGGAVHFEYSSPVLDGSTGAVVTTAKARVQLDVLGEGAIDFPSTDAGQAVIMTAFVGGFPSTSYYLTIPDQPTVSFVALIRDWQVDKSTLEPTTSNQAAWDLTLARVTAIRDEVAAAGVTATLDPADPDVLILSYPDYQTDPDDDLILVLPIGT